MFSLETLSARAACSHDRCLEVIDCKTRYYEERGHYGDVGSSFICAYCGYQYWDEATLRYEWLEDHEYVNYTLVESTDEKDVFIADCETPECPYTNVRVYFK